MKRLNKRQMEVVRNNSTAEMLGCLCEMEVFELAGELYIKTYEMRNADGHIISALKLENGGLVCFERETLVIPRKSKLIVE